MPREGISGYTVMTETYRINVAAGTSAEEYVTDITLGVRRILYKARFIASGDGAGAAATRLFRVIKGASTVAASMTIPLASTTTKGTVTEFTTLGTRDDRTFGDTDTLTLDVTAAGTQFTTLTGLIQITWLVKPQQIAIVP